MDVHPPLAKLLITLAGWLGGFDGNFDFKDIGKDYLEPKVPYVTMRMLPAICGVLTIPTMFLTLKAAGCRTTTAALGAGLVIFGKRRPPYEMRRILTTVRQRSRHPVPPYPPRLASHHLHRHYCTRLDKLHEPARTRTFQSLPAILVVLVGCYWCWTRCDRQCQVGWPLHHRLGRQLDACSTLGPSRRHQKRHATPMVQALLRSHVLSHRHPCFVLHGHVRNPLHLPGQPW
jgi:hypothetical protein